MNRALLFFTALLLLFLGGTLVWYAANRSGNPSGSVSQVDKQFVAPEKALTEFEFTDQLGKPFGTNDLQGKVWMGSFFFADCPSLCVQQNTEIAKLHKRFIDQDVTVVNITVTPDKDPPHKLWDYANRFDADHQRWKFLTGRDVAYVHQVGVDIFSLPTADETHTTDVAVFDRNGQRHGTYKVTDPVEFAKLVTKVETLLAEPSPAQGPAGSDAEADRLRDT